VQCVALAGDHLFAQIVIQHGPFEEGSQVVRRLSIFGQELQCNQGLGDVIVRGSISICRATVLANSSSSGRWSSSCGTLAAMESVSVGGLASVGVEQVCADRF
jgi:hypothetical protein